MNSTTLTAPLITPNARARREAANAVLGMTIFIASWAMLFAALFFAYGLLRARSTTWPPTDLPAIPRGLPTVATLALILSSVGLESALRRIRAGATSSIATRIGSAAMLGLIFLGLQWQVWNQLWHGGLRPDSGPYGSVFFGLTVFHALHVAIGLFALAYLTVASARGTYSPSRNVPVRLWTLYWHMVGVIWVAMYLLLVLL